MMEAKPERLQKILAAAGIASRRKAEELIAAGLVSVNGHVVTEHGTKADPRLDEIRVEGKLLRGPERHVYIAMYKPKGYMTTVSDPEGRPTVMDLLKGVEERVFPVGRLDYMSEGLLLLTNDGDLMAQLTRAGSHVAKTYMVKVSGKPADDAIDKLRNGIMLPPEPGLTGARGRKQPGVERRSFAVLTQPAVIQLAVDQENPWFEVTLTEGRNRQLRRMFEQIGHHIEKIKRVRYGSLTLDLEPGQFRYLTPKEVNHLRKSLETPFKPKPIKPKRKDERKLDSARFVKGRRGKPSAEAAESQTPAARTGAKPAARAAFAAGERRAFQSRDERAPSRRPSGPRGPEFRGEAEGRERRAGQRPFPRKDAVAAGSGSHPKRAFTKRDSPRETAASERGAKRGGFGFERYSKPKFDKTRTEREFAGEDRRPGKPKFDKSRAGREFAGEDRRARKPFGGERERPASDRDFSNTAARRYSKGPGKPERRVTPTESERPAFNRGGGNRAAGTKFGQGFGSRNAGGERGASKHGEGFKNRGGAHRRPSSPARGGGASRSSRRWPGKE